MAAKQETTGATDLDSFASANVIAAICLPLALFFVIAIAVGCACIKSSRSKLETPAEDGLRPEPAPRNRRTVQPKVTTFSYV